jgi:hypothetical protein
MSAKKLQKMMIAILISVLEMCRVINNVLGCCSSSNIRLELSFCLVFIKLMSFADSVKKEDSAPVIMKDSTNNNNNIITIVVMAAGGICVSKNIVEHIVFRNAIFFYNSNIVTAI